MIKMTNDDSKNRSVMMMMTMTSEDSNRNMRVMRKSDDDK